MTPRLKAFLAIVAVLWTGLVLPASNRGLSPLHFTDSQSYWYTAGRLLEVGRFEERFDTGTVPTTWRPPLTALFLAGLRGAGATPREIVTLQYLLTPVTSLLIYLACRRVEISASVSAPVAALFLLVPHVTFLAGTLMSETLSLFLVSATLALAVPERRASVVPHRPLTLVGIGCLAGLMLLTRASNAAVVPGVAVLASLSGPPSRRWRHVALVVAGTLLLMGPWWIRNYLVTSDFVLVNTATGYNFWIGNVHDANVLTRTEDREFVAGLRRDTSETQVSDTLSRIARTHIARDVPGAIKRWLRNGFRFWARPFPLSLWGALLSVAAQATLALSVVLAPLVRVSDARVWALVSMPVLLTLLHAVTFTSWRFWVSVVPPCLILTALVVEKLTETLGRSRTRKATGGIA